MAYTIIRCHNALRVLCFFVFTCFFSASTLASGLSAVNSGKPTLEYLPSDVAYNPAIPTPEAFLGAQVGQWHVRHDQLVQYMYALAKASDRISIEETGRTHENRPLLLLTITNAKNRAQLSRIKQQNKAAFEGRTKLAKDAPLVLYMGYSIHGNEPSGSNASLLIAYYLAAANGDKIDRLLDESVVLLDPSYNPDGLSRFAQWANMHKGRQLVSDPEHREHAEGWPSGRTNHYWFDLNRDWLLLTHPESRARVRQFHAWRPHVLTDFHEMGTNSTYFFQPGVRSRKNPMTPDSNVTLTEALAEYHAKAFDARKELYFSQESFDDFYVGKGSTYPDVHGSIGILFEQASSRGHLQDSINGPLIFSDTIQNHVTTSLSTFEGALANKPALLDYQASFAAQVEDAAKRDDTAGYIVKQPDDFGRFNAMLSLLEQHQIDYQVVVKDTRIEEVEVQANRAIFIPLEQPQYRLIKSLFSTQTTFEDNTFYDVSTWNIAMAFNVEYTPADKRDARKLDTADKAQLRSAAISAEVQDAYAYAIEWHDYNAPALLQMLLENDVTTRAAAKSFTATLTNGKSHAFAPGTVLIPAGLQQPANLNNVLAEASTTLSVPVHSIKSGLTPQGVDLGSRNMVPVNLPKVLLVGGEGTSQYEVGELWHYFDTRVGLPASVVDMHRLNRIKLDDYTHIVMTSGRYNTLDNAATEALSQWVKSGGVLIGQKSAVRWFATNDMLNVEVMQQSDIDDAFDTSGMRYEDRDGLYARKLVAGTAYQAHIDTSHPLFFGYKRDHLAMFKTSNMVVKSDNSPFITPARYTDNPLLAGYSAPELQKLIANTAAAIVQPKGQGVVIGLTDNTQFRGYWYGTNKMMANAVYMSVLMN